MNIFTFKNYKDVLNHLVELNSETRGYRAKLAEAAGCQRSYLSQVLNGHVHLTPDHAYGLTIFWEFSEHETEFFCLLVDLERAGFGPLKEKISRKIERIIEDQKNLNQKILNKSSVQTIFNETDYYSSWFTAAIHLATEIPSFQTVPDISKRFNLPEDLVRNTLMKLEEMKLVEKNNKKYKISSGDNHLSKDSPLVKINHSNWRQKTILDSNFSKNGNLHYTSVQTHSDEDFEELKNLLIKMIEKSRKVITKSPAEEVSCFCLDFFRV